MAIVGDGAVRIRLVRSLRGRLFAAAMVSLVLPMGGAAYYVHHRADAETRAVRDLAARIVDQGIQRQEDLLREARSLLGVLALVPEVRNASGPGDAACIAILKDIPKHHRWTTGVWVARPDGMISCDTSGSAEPINLADRPYFQAAVNGKDYVTSGYVLGRRSKRPVIIVVKRVEDATGLRGLIGVSVDLEWYADLLKASPGTQERMMVLDAGGTVIARQPDPEGWIGRSLSEFPHVQQMLAAPAGVTEAVSADGVRRVWSWRRVENMGGTMAVGLSTEEIAAGRRERIVQGGAVIAVIALFNFLAVWAFLRFSITGWLGRLISAASHIGSGGTGATVEAAGAPDEVAMVMRAFNRMSGQLADRERDLITAHAEAEGAERRARDLSLRLGTVLESTSDCIVALDRAWRFTYLNSRAVEVLGPERDLLGAVAWVALPDLVGSRFQRECEAVLRDQRPVEFVDRLEPGDNWFHVTAHPSVEGIVVYFNDVTAQVRAERAQRESEARFKGIVELANDAIVSVDDAHTIVLFNAGAERIFGYAAAEVMGQPLDLLIPERYRAAHGGHITAFGESSGARGALLGQRGCVNGLRKDGAEVVLQTSVSVLKSERGNVFTAIIRDVSEQQRAEDELRRAKAAAEAAARAKTDFLATMSHEIRTPLNALIGFSDLLLRGDVTDAERAHYLSLQRDAGRTLLSVVNDVLDFSKIEAGRLEIETLPTDPRDLVEGCRALFVRAAQEKGLDLCVEVSPEVPAWLSADPTRLRQVLLNLLNNAIKFTSSGRVTLSVAVMDAAGRTGGTPMLRIVVADTGIGIPPERVGYLFEAFSQLDRSISRRYGGSGLGLAICRRLVEMMGGRIGVDSTPGEGSAFWLEFPLVEAAAPGVESEPQVAPLRRAIRVLLAEDLLANRLLVRRILKDAGCQVDEAPDGVAALAAAQECAYDLILMDVQMPVMDGLEATRRIRALPGAAGRVPIVAVTAHALSEQIQECRAAGMDGHLAKPVESKALLRLVAWCADGASADTRDAVLWSAPIAPVAPPAPGEPRTRGVAGSGAPSIDVADGLRRVDGDEAFFKRFLADFARQYDGFADAVGPVVAAGDLERVRHQTHDLKSVAGIIGARRLSALADAVQIAAKSGRRAEGEALLPEIAEELVAVLAMARQLLAAPAVRADGAPDGEAGSAASADQTDAPDRDTVRVALDRLLGRLREGSLAALDAAHALAGGLTALVGADLADALIVATDGLDFARAEELVHLAGQRLDAPRPAT